MTPVKGRSGGREPALHLFQIFPKRRVGRASDEQNNILSCRRKPRHSLGNTSVAEAWILPGGAQNAEAEA